MNQIGVLMKKNDELYQNSLLKRRATINPYLFAAALVIKRLNWDLNPKSWVSRTRLRKWKNKYSGQKAVIVCNGPSLLKSDLSLLDNVFTFGLNKINLLFDKSAFRPSCIVAVNPYVLEQNADFYNETEIPLFLDRCAPQKGLRFRENVVLLHSTPSYIKQFARDCSISIHSSGTVTYVAMQVAFHMGFKNVALIGCDHNFVTKGAANMTVEAGEKDSNHFAPNYFAGGVKWQLPDLFESEIGYTLAKNMYECYGSKIVNATEGGQLDIFDRISLAEFIHENDN